MRAQDDHPRCLAIKCNKPASKVLKLNVVSENDEDCASVETEVFACPDCATVDAAEQFLGEAGRMRSDIEKAFKGQSLPAPDWDKSRAYWGDIPVKFILPDSEIKVSKLSDLKRRTGGKRQ